MMTDIVNPYYVAYNMINLAFNNKDYRLGIKEALKQARQYISADSILLCHINETNDFEVVATANDLFEKYYGVLLDNVKKLFECKECIDVKLHAKSIERLTLSSIITENNNRYVLLVVNSDVLDSDKGKKISNLMIETLSTILSKIEVINNLKEKSEIDSLSKLYNRSSYDNTISNLISSSKKVTYTLIDLFRLKYINDNINHAAGDEYIKLAAHKLSKYFPEFLENDSHNAKRVNSGNYLYRIGGDEFVLLSTVYSKEEIIEILEMVRKEIEKIIKSQ